MKFVQWDIKERQNKQWYSKKIFLDGNDLNSPWSLVQKIKIQPHETAESHYHKIQTEIFYFLNDNGYRIVNGEEIHPKKWDVLVIEPDDKHTVINTTDQDYLYLAFKISYVSDDLHWD
jgi:quercetin dioxygenase-like cupin family protein